MLEPVSWLRVPIIEYSELTTITVQIIITLRFLIIIKLEARTVKMTVFK